MRRGVSGVVGSARAPEISAFVVPIVIHPAEQADREGGKLDPVGTGPMQFVEWVPDSHIRLKRFDAGARFGDTGDDVDPHGLIR